MTYPCRRQCSKSFSVMLDIPSPFNSQSFPTRTISAVTTRNCGSVEVSSLYRDAAFRAVRPCARRPEPAEPADAGGVGVRRGGRWRPVRQWVVRQRVERNLKMSYALPGLDR